jgi:hypothetical protein
MREVVFREKTQARPLQKLISLFPGACFFAAG